MILIACVDDDMGMMFNHRRQSRDSQVIKRILEICAGRKLWMTKYSGAMFEAPDGAVIISDDFPAHAGQGDFCFAEDMGTAAFEEAIEDVILFRWNRKYPSDVKFDLPLRQHGWQMVSTAEFPGSSHEKITEEHWTR